jgi:MoxR-like ATPase
MNSKINVRCEKCGAQFRAMEDELNQLACPSCSGRLRPDAAAQAAASAAPAAPTTPTAPAPAASPTPAAPAPPAATAAAKSVPSRINSTQGDAKGIADVHAANEQIRKELAKVIVGQQEVVDEILVALLAGGHCLLEGVPGLAKTLLISSLAKALSLSFRRIQFTPDLMPSDITGTDIIQEDPVTGRREYQFLPGPIFANIILADEINRTPPKTQASMLEAMQEKQTSIGGKVHALPSPFFVLATQNPLEQEGTYPLPEAQQDRFLFKIFVDYPNEKDEKEIIHRVTARKFGEIAPVMSAADILAAQDLAARMPVADTVVDYATRLVRATRINRPDAPDFVNKWVAWGCGPRASIALIGAAKALAALRNANCASCDDVARVAHPVMRHRLAVNYTARAEGVNTDTVVDKLLATIAKY